MLAIICGTLINEIINAKKAIPWTILPKIAAFAASPAPCHHLVIISY
ncbi:MAG: hypothetical protein H9Q65_05620 [Spiroplasma ixodetis]|nr:hypothetical protein [Spiroplasma ixodetis]MBP1528701.1 hypothetical protein [Spiroplasma ixodetis]